MLTKTGLGEVEAAVGIDGLAGNETASRKEDGDAGYFFHCAEGADGKAIGSERGKIGDHVGFNECGSDGVYGDSLFGEEGCVGASEAENSGFRGGIMWADDAAVLRGDRREIDDAAPLFFAHGGKRALRYQEDGSEIYADGFVPVGFGDLLGRKSAGNTGIVDKDVDGAEIPFDFGEEARDLGRVRDIGLNGDATAAEIRDFGGHIFSGFALLAVVDGDVGAFFR